MRLKLLTLALALSAISLPSHGEDLLDAYREARANDPVLSQADAQRLSVGEGVTQARALLLPQISAGLTLSQTNGTSSSTSSSSQNYGPDSYLCSGIAAGSGSYNCTGPLQSSAANSNVGHSRTRDISATLSQSILDLSKIADLKAAHSQASAQDALYQAALQDLFVRVATAYFNVLTSQDSLTFAKANEEAYRQQYEQSDQRYKVGLSAITDVYQAKSFYESAKAQTIAAQNALDDAREALAQITGKPTGELKKLRDDLPMDPPQPNDQKAWVQQALQNNPNLLSDKYSVDAAEHSISAARAGHLPTISATVNYGKSATWYQNSTDHFRRPSSTTVGLTLSVPLFSGGATQSRVRQSIYQRDAAQDSLEADRRQVQRNTLNYYRSVIAGISQVEAAKSAVEAGQKALDATRAGFSVGTKTILDVLTAIQTLTSSESQYSQARHQFILDKLLLKQAAGAADFKDMESINTLLE
ncbi:TolC family outer membrane protein [Dyella lutea]|uniref:TolC family outer membrane protein n=1 Tax=Dyella lutea TaxID=2950441 RepID=A0ABT1F734_9GAMM|nr:TolC family outer membrane protein [Dyella lutea]MCP1373197.1 TolC family outer membrane protein [Dyella lutea]